MSTKKIAHVWIFVSCSDPDKTYETLQFEDRSTSCSCPGWTRRVQIDGTRSCRHTRLVHMGEADHESKRHVDYSDGDFQSTPPTTNTKPYGTKKTKASTFGNFGGRSILK